MIYSVNLIDLTENINPLAFAKYLKDTGWILLQNIMKEVRFWLKH